VGGAAAPPEKAKANLMAGVFLLAEGVSLDEARQALDAAGDSASAGLYKDRWEAAKMGAAEAAAKAAWLRLQDAAKPGITPATAKRLTDLLGDFEKKHGETKYGKGVAKGIEDLKTRIEDSVLCYTKWPFDEAEARRRQKATADALGVKIEEDIDLGGGVKMTFVLIPAGEFFMGSPPTTSPKKLAAAYGGDPKEYEGEFPQHRVKISRPFWLGKFEVTQEQWQALMGNNPSKFVGRPQNPVEAVSWDDCQGFLQKLSAKLKKTFRLPTEGQWEYACRAGAASEFYFGDSKDALGDYAWLGANSGGMTHPVGRKKPNGWGLHDMAGDVDEWCEDWLDAYDKGDQKDPKGPPSGPARVFRGGSWLSYPWGLRSAFRRTGGPGGRHGDYGFRVVLAQGPR
jgi:formylglycine-generating enzyme required for sulfatase activity